MTLDSIALWLGYGVMVAGGMALVLVLLIVAALLLNSKIKLLGKYLQFYWDLKTLRATMRQLETEGKVSKKVGVQP